jgi:hypothetical protein
MLLACICSLPIPLFPIPWNELGHVSFSTMGSLDIIVTALCDVLWVLVVIHWLHVHWSISFIFLDSDEYFLIVFVKNYTIYATDNLYLYEYTFSSPNVFSVIFTFAKNRPSDTVMWKLQEPIPVTQLVREVAAVMQEFTQSG